jgi:hypothetical protein
MLCAAIDVLVSVGVSESRLLGKLKRDRDVWPTWAEIYAASELVQYQGPGSTVDFEPNREQGRQPDYVFRTPGRRDVFCEFKAIGLSYAESRFCRAVYPALEAVQRPGLFVNIHVPSEATDEAIEAVNATLANRSQTMRPRLPRHLWLASGVSVVVHGSQESYLARVQSRADESRGQLENVPDGAACWISVHATAHAPLSAVHEWLERADLPGNVVGVVLVGAVLRLDSDIQRFGLVIPRGADPTDIRHYAHSPVVNAALALETPTLLDLGVRPTAVSLYKKRGSNPVPVFKRDGSARIVPFNLQLESDSRIRRSSRVGDLWERLPDDAHPSWTPGEV